MKEKVEEMFWEREALWLDRREHQSNNKRLFGKFKQSNATKAPTDVRRCDLEVRLTMSDVIWALAWDALKEKAVCFLAF